MDDFFTMIILVDTSKCPKSRQEMLDLFAEESKKLALDIRMQNEEIFQAMHRIWVGGMWWVSNPAKF